ncbi:MAG: LLM class flavin-dependent oxidoreductase [Streptosporangiales bacterium]|nr:LLM class flavin-dependent oxidoreductase [Streptosporangiales bacterium]
MSGYAEIGLGLQSDKRGADYARLAELAEDTGFDVLSVFSDLLYQPPIYALLEMARVTQRVRLGAACWNPYTMHPYEIAGQLAVLDDASDGRAYLGLARGTWLDAIGIRQRRPVAHLRDAVRVIRALLRGDGTGVEGDVFRLAPGTRLRYPLPDRVPPLLIGTWGERTAALAGELADEVKVGGTANPAVIDVLTERIAVGRARAGRPDDAVGVVVGAVTVVDEDGAAARAKARLEVAMYLAVVGGLDPTVALPGDLLDAVSKHVDAGDHERAGACIPDDVLDLFAFAGTPEQVAAQAQRLIDAGARRVEFGTPHGLTDAGGVELLGRRVLPLLRRGTRP